MSKPEAHSGVDSNDYCLNSDQIIASSLGAQLAAYRQEHGWSIEQVARQLNLATKQVVAIENDDYAALPGMPIARGFIRAYAKLLKVDPAPLLPPLKEEVISSQSSLNTLRPTVLEPFSNTRSLLARKRSNFSAKKIVVLLVLVFLCVLLLNLRGLQKSDAVTLLKFSTLEIRTDILSFLRTAIFNRAVQEETKTTNTLIAEPASYVISSLNQPKAGLEVSSVPNNMVYTQEPTKIELGSALFEQSIAMLVLPDLVEKDNSKNILNLNLREDSWVEIKGIDSKKIIISQLVNAGDTKVFEVAEPISLTIGNSAGVDASFRGTPIELKQPGRGKVVRLNLK